MWRPGRSWWAVGKVHDDLAVSMSSAAPPPGFSISRPHFSPILSFPRSILLLSVLLLSPNQICWIRVGHYDPRSILQEPGGRHGAATPSATALPLTLDLEDFKVGLPCSHPPIRLDLDFARLRHSADCGPCGRSNTTTRTWPPCSSINIAGTRRAILFYMN
jgi:hypothetical protein